MIVHDQIIIQSGTSTWLFFLIFELLDSRVSEEGVAVADQQVSSEAVK